MSEGRTKLRRVGVLGDVHAEDALLERGIAFLRSREVDAMLCVGDLVDGLGDVDRAVDLLREASVLTVAGNHERWFLAEEMRSLPNATLRVADRTRAYLAALPRTLDFETVAGTLRLCHGVGDDDMAELRPETRGYALQSIPTLRDLMLDPRVDFCLGGHTHVRMVRCFPGVTMINAGTLVRTQGPVVLVLDFVGMRYAFHGLGEDGEITLAEEGPLPAPTPVPDGH